MEEPLYDPLNDCGTHLQLASLWVASQFICCAHYENDCMQTFSQHATPGEVVSVSSDIHSLSRASSRGYLYSIEFFPNSKNRRFWQLPKVFGHHNYS